MQQHHTAFLPHSALEDSENSLARVLRLGKQWNALYLYFISFPQEAIFSPGEDCIMVDKLVNNGLAIEAVDVYLCKSTYLL
jgi:hypothetical protein